jgi:preprotein translocase subunit SecY
LKRRLLFLLGALIVYRIGTHIPVPGINASVLDELFKSQQNGILGLFNVFSGGALSRFSILALGIMPYISASIIMQLCTVVVPTLEALKKEGEAGAARSPSTRDTQRWVSRSSRRWVSRSHSRRSRASWSRPDFRSG